MFQLSENSLAFMPEFDKGIMKVDLIPLIDETLLEIKRVSRGDPRITEIIKASIPKATQLAGIELDMAEELTRKYNKKAIRIFEDGIEKMDERAVRRGLAQFTAKEADEFVKLLGPEFAKLGPEMQKELVGGIGAFYRFGRNAPLLGKVGFVPSLNLIDRRSMDFLAKDTTFWIGSHYDTNLSNAVRGITSDAMVAQGLGRKEAGKLLQRNLTGYIKDGRLPDIDIPQGWTGSSLDYFTSFAANIRNNAVSMSRIQTFQQAGVETYEVVAVIDRRTSDICNFMNGKIFNVSWASETVEQVLNAKSPEEVKDIRGWKRADEAMKIAGVSKPTGRVSPEGSHAMHKAGLDYPPYHFRCRTTIIASSESEIIIIGSPPPMQPTPKQGKVPKKPKPPPTTLPKSRGYKGQDPKNLRFKTTEELDSIYANQITEFEAATKGLVPGSDEWQKAFNKKMNELFDESGGLAREVRGVSTKPFISSSEGVLRKKKAWDGNLLPGEHSTATVFKVKVRTFEKNLSRYWTVQANETTVIKNVKFNQTRRGTRAGYLKNKISVSVTHSPSTYVHEFGHHLESGNKLSLKKEATRFLKDRTKKDKIEKLKEILPGSGYDDWETVKKDKFFSPYCGKVYNDGSTEVLSMGMERFVNNPSNFFQEDPDYFSFIFGIMRGEITAPIPIK